ncbi:hypothetical protein NADFUDRAFT_81461 [Nadsonia fulvescens var. elongata DSM 6958]|uniref:cAMP-independent regulatory protein pac2 n=1 Tax=Nadsonia fulvescens var. elongata DSM 6958 TaxID=857566 RepID=A0A1E3PSY6_9ASCO|nr:hypothetical protein NADFUDRAFT_81461 [Nadsonia fulvescens var. elongata DSM 6958]
MRRWTDGKSWSASRVAGSFLTYREMEGRQPADSVETSANASNAGSNNISIDDDEFSQDGYKYKVDGLIKQSFSITTSTNLKLHLISYFSRAHATHSPDLMLPSHDIRLRNITIPQGLYPDASLLLEHPPIHNSAHTRPSPQYQQQPQYQPSYQHQLPRQLSQPGYSGHQQQSQPLNRVPIIQQPYAQQSQLQLQNSYHYHPQGQAGTNSLPPPPTQTKFYPYTPSGQPLSASQSQSQLQVSPVTSLQPPAPSDPRSLSIPSLSSSPSISTSASTSELVSGSVSNKLASPNLTAGISQSALQLNPRTIYQSMTSIGPLSSSMPNASPTVTKTDTPATISTVTTSPTLSGNNGAPPMANKFNEDARAISLLNRQFIF